jgi:hypothetical protein
MNAERQEWLDLRCLIEVEAQNNANKRADCSDDPEPKEEDMAAQVSNSVIRAGLHRIFLR